MQNVHNLEGALIYYPGTAHWKAYELAGRRASAARAEKKEHLMIGLWKKACVAARFMRSRAFLASLLIVAAAGIIGQVSAHTHALYLVDGSQRTLAYVPPEQAVALAEDGASISRYGALTQVNTAKGNLFNAQIRVDGKVIDCEVKNGVTVGELLYEQGIHYDGNDLLSLDAQRSIQNGDQIVLQRVEYNTRIQDEVIPYEVVHKTSSLIAPGDSKVLTKGQAGLRRYTYMTSTIDGKRQEDALLGEKLISEPVNETILIGSVAPVSPLDFDIEVDEDGKPLHYEKVFTNQVATGYSARPGAKTASGRVAVPGHVAVNPEEIPYGSQLYITTEDNQFVYGCAVAADTGIGLLYDVVDVDLFYDTYQESCLNGRRIVDIYVLSTPDQDDAA